ncbi:hypothetical protein M408DRAFT_26787 [Serendipita vermifera MAFF 305830]|uniref:Cwf19-like C-terminal domain-containing protein n=1 Tax=Serendipita vermifera MAFF 305830 TaxID=933852 RepID=A0A0C2WE00_SERVB|nr:hypothetical protein M408DRAFT_26787 [Serendipita vermifera MAFF 305830]
MDETKERHSKRKASRHEEEGKRKKKHHKEEHDSKSSSKKKDRHKAIKVVDDDAEDDDMWVEHNIDVDGQHPVTTTIPTGASLELTSSANAMETDAELPRATTTESKQQREEWMLLQPSAPVVPLQTPPLHSLDHGDTLTDGYGDSTSGNRTASGNVDFFSGLGTEHRRRDAKDKNKVETVPKVSSRELNPELTQGVTLPSTSTPKAIVPGGPGSQWRMMRLRRTYETAEEENKSVEEVALEKYGSLEAFNEAVEERRILDERAGKKTKQSPSKPSTGETRYSFYDSSGPPSRGSFKKPGEAASSSNANPLGAPANKRLDSLKAGQRPPASRTPSNQTSQSTPTSHTPIPSVMTPQLPSTPPVDLNKLQAKVLRAKLMNAPNAADLEREYEEAKRTAEGLFSAEGKKLQVLPTMDGQGRLYDVGSGKADDPEKLLPGNRRKKEKLPETRDPKTGELVRYNEDDDTTTLGDMLRQERFGAGMADQKEADSELARAIMSDGKFQDDLEYMDDNAEKLGRKKMRSDAMKRQFAINDYAKTQKVMASCVHCYGEDDSPPKAAVIAMGTRSYLACTTNQELVPGHCHIVPIQHHLSTLEGDDDLWDEITNFMKCLMRMFHEEDKGVVFFETVISLRWQKHTYIECIPVPYEHFEELPGYFKESIMMSEAEWSQHKKLIDFSARPGGFRRAMVPNLPYFMVQFDYKGQKGFGHVIEGVGDAAGGGDPDGAMDEGEKGGGEFPKWFAAEIIGNILDLEPRLWRKPRWIDRGQNKSRVAAFKKQYDAYDWTKMLRAGAS